MTVINTNINALIAANSSTVNGRSVASAMQQLSTGKRINSARDDSAGLAISETMTAQIRGLDMAVRNANDGISLLQTAEGAMVEQTNMMQRMRELAVQAASDTLSADQKGYVDTEFQNLLTEIDRIGGNTQWNSMNIMDASGGQASGGSFVFQVGANASQSITVNIKNMASSGSLSDLASLAVDTASNAGAAITAIDTALGVMATQRATLGGGINQLTYASDNLMNISQNATESRSRVLDTDYAAATSKLAKSQIIAQAATAMLAQANQQPQSVLALLK